MAVDHVQMQYGRRLGFVAVDYLAKMSKRGFDDLKSCYQHHCDKLKTLAITRDCPVFLIHSLNRSSGEECPTDVNALSGADEVGYEADIVAYAYRPAYYANEKSGNAKSNGRNEGVVANEHEFWLYHAKNRQGQTGLAKLAWFGHVQRFADYSEDPAKLTQDVGWIDRHF